MRRILFKIIIPLFLMGVWVDMCYWICRTDTGMEWFLFWIMCGFPYGIRRMSLLLIQRSFGIAGGIGILAFHAVIGGLVGGVLLILRLAEILREIIACVTGHFWSQRPEVGKEEDGIYERYETDHGTGDPTRKHSTTVRSSRAR